MQGNPPMDLQDKGVIYSGCSRNMICPILQTMKKLMEGMLLLEKTPKEGKSQKRTRIVEENLHIRFSENTPNVVAYSKDDDDDDIVADMNNMDTTIQVSLIPTTKIHKDHPLDQVIGDLHSTTQTRQMSKNLEKHRFVSTIQQSDADEDITLVDVETQVDLGAKLQGRKDDDNDAIKDVSATEPTVFDDEEVTMTVAQTLIKMKAKKVGLLDEQMAKRLHDEEVEQATAREKQEKDDLEKAKVLQQQKYQSLKRKPIFIAQARKNMFVYLKNVVGYKMEHFRGITYDKESFKKLKAVEVLGSHPTQDTPTDDHKEMIEEDVQNMLEIVPVSEFKVEAL
nr:hypothetical protein [Tanacetum cinerariifolium]